MPCRKHERGVAAGVLCVQSARVLFEQSVDRRQVPCARSPVDGCHDEEGLSCLWLVGRVVKRCHMWCICCVDSFVLYCLSVLSVCF